MVGTVLQGSPAWRGKRVVAEINCVCRQCDMCHSGLANHCRKRTVMGIVGRDGCFADAVAMPEHNLHEVPEGVTDEQAVFTEPLAAAFQVLAQCPIEARQTVTVVGSGRLGTLVAQVLAATGCKLTVVGRNAAKLALLEKRGIQTFGLDDLNPRRDRDVVVECSGSPGGLELAMRLVRPRGTIVLKSTHAGATGPNLARVVVDEIRVIGSRCGPFAEALNALARRAVDVSSLVTRTMSLDQALSAFEAVRRRETLKILLKVAAR
jgi:threonine dehydrogenase-like Zn-dependent dehydrogenase